MTASPIRTTSSFSTLHLPETFKAPLELEPVFDELDDVELPLLPELDDFPDDEDFAELLLLPESEDFLDEEDFAELLLFASFFLELLLFISSTLQFFFPLQYSLIK